MKQLLFFDIECSNCYGGNGKVCEFGAVLTDENFNIIREFDIPMCPGKGRESRFDMTFLDRTGGYSWAYDIEYYMDCPEFPNYYKTIKNLLEDENTIVFGYAVDNDIRYVGSSTKRYHLAQPVYRAHDIQKLLKKYSKEKFQVGGLNCAFLNMCGTKAMASMCPHLSRDDAKMTMMVLKAMCENLEMSITQLLELCPDCYYNSIEYLEAYEARKEKKRLHPELYAKRHGGHIKSECQVAWGELYREHLPLLEKEESIGNIVAISSKLKESMEVITNTIETIKKNNLVAFNGITGSDILVVYDEEDKDRLLTMFKHPYNGKIIMYNDFVSQCAA